MTKEEKQKAIDAIRISAPIMSMTHEEFDNYIQTLNKVMDWLEQEPCDDAISRKAVINQIFYSTDNNGDVVLGSALRERIARLLPVTPQEPRWISVSERLPEEDGEYLVAVKRGYVTIALWVGDAEFWSEVIAWMKLPEPYQPKDGEK